MREVPVTAAGSPLAPRLIQATAALRELRTLAEVIDWARQQPTPLQVDEIVTQDEYTHDVVLPLDGMHFLVFDAT
jgi:hypothetical protein